MSIPMTLEEFYIAASDRKQRTGERYGQALFNLLAEVRPDLADLIRSTDKDPYFCEDVVYGGDQRMEDFIRFLADAW